ncbi:VanZ family protein [uncultured Dokdonia sp.]|uniref:VanZ family protein n=1 Tax=uncultured Dokdonia sp. TaxID=575653 RepID=UPI002635FFBD|nr:VanZ family protein [uncultured Dokdonia sp.]
MRLSLGHKALFVIAISYTIALTLGSLIRPVHIVEHPISNIDKLLHAGAYFGLTILWIFWVFFKRSKKTTISSKKLWQITLGVVVMAVLYGVLMEVLQGTLTSYRTPDGWDVLANTTGSLLALIACVLYINKSKMLKSKF